MTAETEASASRRAEALRGLRDALPIVLAYVPVGVTFGVVAVSNGLPVWMACLLSLVIYAGASQFIFVTLAAAAAGPVSMVVTLLLVNLRHALYGATLGRAFARWPEARKWLAAWGLTDEVFAVLGARVTGATARGEAPERVISQPYHYALAFAAYAAWVGGTVVGALIGQAVPAPIAAALTYGLPALFLALLLNQRPTRPQLAAALLGALVAVAVRQLTTSGADIVAGALVGATVGALLAARAERTEQPRAQADARRDG
jgi:4-azaleucine resistance transporter AzlC